ncbi:unnamed protein product [Candidula unifasciata]|uniref:WH1 domain-containing protein n=1 Tax=Candidula unifasciata TaxID=100452 RepID=A0A8S3Z3D5_9EUPU|nr:unnamed protein product [Candidula unifasciata]
MLRRAPSWRDLGVEGDLPESTGSSQNLAWTGSPAPERRGDKSKDAGEQPIFTTKAHVFQIDGNTKKDWIPASKSAVSVSFYFDSIRNTYRIISVDGSKAIVNSTITPNMTFTKTSQKFGQWSDARANTVYGLGFPSEQELTKFIEKFKEVKELTRQAAQTQLKQMETNGGVDSHILTQSKNQNLHQRTSSLSSIQTDVGNLRERRNSFTQGGNNDLPSSTSTEAQLKYENDRLKLALAQSSANAKKWEVELQTLKNNNARLTTALQESTSNVDEWKKQLAAYKDENVRLKKKLLEVDKGGSGGAENSHKVAQLTEQLERLRHEYHSKQEEIQRLSAQIEELKASEGQSSALQARIKSLEGENQSLSLKLQDSQRQLQESRTQAEQEQREILRLQEILGAKISELYETHESIVATLKHESNS